MVRQLATCIVNRVMDRVLNAGSRSEQGEWLAFEVWRLRIAKILRKRDRGAPKLAKRASMSVAVLIQVRCIINAGTISLMWGV